MNFIKSSLKYKQVTLSVLGLMFLTGVYSLFTMPRREDPEITIRQGLIIAYFPGASSVQVEAQVTKTLEDYLFQFDEVKKDKTYSMTQDGLVVVNVSLEDNVKEPKIFWNTLRHQMLVTKQLNLPPGVVGPIVDSDFGDTEAIIIGLRSLGADYAQLEEYIKKLEDYLLPVTAVSKIKRIGEQPEQISILFNSFRLSQYGLNEADVLKILQSQNLIGATGSIYTTTEQVPLYTTGYYQTQEEIANQVIGTSKTGEVIRLRDVAEVKRAYTDPTSTVSINGNIALILSLQMEAGNNIVQFGKAVDKKVEEVKDILPSDVELVTFVNQPSIVKVNVNSFIREFLLAIISVIIVIVLLLPFRVAFVAAMAIPMTIAVTIALMNLLGVELQQVSLAALIVVLGMVVDDAIVIADNYIELLDEGEKPWTAAWRSASELIVPVFTATITIIAAFIPIVLLTGVIGEFIHALPITVTIALASSFTVAMLFTPMLCFTFIKKGLNDNKEKDGKKKRRTLLDIMQDQYNKILEWVVKRPVLVISVSLLTILLAGLIFKFGIRQKFFPAAERNQFVIEMWLPTDTKLDKTREKLTDLENLLKNDDRVLNYTTFAGTGAPRFYYNFSPEFPVTNYGMILINTTNTETAAAMRTDLFPKVGKVVPEGMVDVKLMQQGQPLDAPVEVRVVGEDIPYLEMMGDSIKSIIRKSKGSRLVHTDFHESYYGISVNLKEEASRLGFTTQSVSEMIYAAFSGAPVTSVYEGDKKLNVVFRLEEDLRRTTDQLKDLYVSSPVTGASVPLEEIADITPEWSPGRIMRRNGIRTITVQSETYDNVLPSKLLAEIKPQVNNIKLHPGYFIDYGGESGNQEEIMSQLIKVLLISLLLIFLILLFQFRNIKECVIVMLTIPLSLLGAMLGLFITGNNFGFTSFIGLISLSGVVVRNAIILVDYANGLVKQGTDIRTAAMESGRRRLRPIFLTAMAAAIGVFPMILSGSSLWSPMASVIAAGVIWSMFMSLLTIPVIYMQWVKPNDKKDPEETVNKNEVKNK
ncbi:MAG: efflux RND transporter permease subunit [Candidatus Azobacteroides sp.]|nr:efflux RND transporter permease subunit [Candidatus Azobacteroides sp.]